MLNRVAWSTAKGVGVNRLGGECSGPKPESYPRTYPNPRISEDDPGPDPLDPEDHQPGPRYPRGTPGGPRRGLHAVPDPESAPLCPKRPIAAGLAARAVTGAG